MRASDYLADQAVVDELLAKKRLGPKQKERLATLSDRLSQVTHPAPRPRRVPTGERGDFQGNVYAMHYQRHNCATHRETVRANRFGVGQIKFKRSRIQRARRKQRTGGVK